VEAEIAAPEPTRDRKQNSDTVTAIDLEAGAGPFYEADPITLGVGMGFRQVMTAADIVGPSARFGVLTTALVHLRDEPTGAGRQTALFGGAPFFADIDLYGRLGPIFRLGIGTRAGLYVAPHLFPLFALGAGVAADVGKLRFELVARLQPLPTHIGNAGSGQEVWTRTGWLVIPTVRVSLPIGK
jgi:hypothetical protein